MPALIMFHTLHGIVPRVRPGIEREMHALISRTMQEWGNRSSDSLDRYRRKTELAVHLLDDGYSIDPARVAEVYQLAMNEHHTVQKDIHFSDKDASSKTGHEHAEVAVKALLSLYHDLYENYLRLLISPISFAKDVIALSNLPVFKQCCGTGPSRD